MSTLSKVYRWYYRDRPSIDAGSHTISFSSLTEEDPNQLVTGQIESVTVQFIMLRQGSATVSVNSQFSLSDGTNTYTSDWVFCSGITASNAAYRVFTLSSNCPSANFFNAKNFTLTISFSNPSRSSIYLPEGRDVILTVNYTNSALSYVLSSGSWRQAKPYAKDSLTFPTVAMTSNSSGGCVASCSSVNNATTQVAYKAFDKNDTTLWASSESDTNKWIQLIFPVPLTNITVYIKNRNDGGTPKGLITGTIYGSNDEGATLTEIGTISRDGFTNGLLTSHSCSTNYGSFNCIRIVASSSYGSTHLCIGEIYFTGIGMKEIQPFFLESGAWK